MRMPYGLLTLLSALFVALPVKAQASSTQPHACAPHEDPWIEIVRSSHELRFWCGHRVHKTYPVALGRAGYETQKGYHRVQYQRFYEKPLNAAVTDVFIWLYYDEVNGLWIGIHGTSLVNSLGSDASMGCIRMAPGDALEIAQYTYTDMVVWIRDSPWSFSN